MSETVQESRVRAKLETQKAFLEKEEKRAVLSNLQTVHELRPARISDMSGMARLLRNAFVITLAATIGIIVTTESGLLKLGLHVKLPFEGSVFHFIVASFAVIYGGSFFLTAAWRALRRRTANAATLIAMVVFTIYIYSIGTTFFIKGQDLFIMATSVLAIVLLGYWLETMIWGRLTDPIKSFARKIPLMANLMAGRSPTVIPARSIKTGNLLLVRPGEKVPVDGVITSGSGLIDQSEITGDIHPVIKGKGQAVIGGTRNLEGTFVMKAIKVADNSTAAKITGMLEGALRSSTESQRMVDRIASYLVPIVVIVSAIAFITWYINAQGLVFAFVAAIAIAIAASPNAISLSVPVPIATGVVTAATQGLLIKTADAVGVASEIDTIIFDKVSCLTVGDPEVTDIIHVGKLTEPGFLRLAASLMKNSDQPMGRAIVNAAERLVGKGIPNPEKYHEVPNEGTIGELETRTIIVGTGRLMNACNIDIERVRDRAEALAKQGRVVIYVAVDNLIEGVLGIEDRFRSDAKDAIKKLHDLQIEVAMICADELATAKAIAAKLDIDKIYAEVVPKDRAEKIKEVKGEGLNVAVVGRRTHDDSALEQADLGIAVTDGTDIDIDSSDVVLLRNNPFDVINLITLSRMVMGKVKQNIIWGVMYNILAIPIAAGILTPIFGFQFRPEYAAFLMSASTLAVMANSLSLKKRAVKINNRPLAIAYQHQNVKTT
ncbi:MAG: heavy metal translocating P-type ATPase [Firmicutes bacterium]|nr:heavy metal translocating P-type ATPase [Bacillota bacterium]